MKKFLSILSIFATLAVVFYTNHVAQAQVVDPMLALANVTLVPAITRDPANAQPIPTFTRAQKALFEYLEQKSQGQTRQALAKGALVFDPITYYIRFAITGLSGRQQIVSEGTVKQVGITNFDRGLLRQYYNFCFDRISVRYATGNSVTTALGGLDYSSVRAGAMAPALHNGELIVIQNKNTIIETPVMDFVSAAAITGGGLRNFDGGVLEAPKVLEENKQVELWIAFAGTVPSATNTIYGVEVALQGVQARINN